MMRLTRLTAIWLASVPSLALCQVNGSGVATIHDGNYAVNGTSQFSDSLYLSMSGVSDPAPGMQFFCWLLADDDTSYKPLGPLTVSGGSISFGYLDPDRINLIQDFKQLFISEESEGFGGTSPTPENIRFRAALYEGPGSPDSTNALTYVRNAIGAFSTPNNRGLATWLVRQLIKPDNLVQHAGFAAASSTVSEVKMHTDHCFDFLNGALSGLTGASSIATNGDPLGYGFYRYGDLATDYTLLGGAGYHVSLAITRPDAGDSLTAGGNNALLSLRNVFGDDNASGWAKELKDKCLQILTTNYGTNLAGAKADAEAMKNLCLKVQDGNSGAGSNDPATGGIFTAYWRIQAMASYVITPILDPPSAVTLVSPSDGATLAADSIVCIWDSGEPAVDGYWFEIATDSLLSAPVVDSLLSPADTTKLLPSLIADQRYWWRVRARNAAGWGPFSEAWSFSIATTGVIEAGQLPQTFWLGQNFPNPFNSSTTIPFDLPAESFVTLSVFDLAGSEVRVLLRTTMPLGKHAVRFEADELSSGVYVYRMRVLSSSANMSPWFSESRKLIYLK